MHALLISDNSSIRDAITVLMDIFHPGSRVVCATEVLHIHSILETGRIDVAFMDAATPGFGDRIVANALEYRHPEVRILVLGPGANRQSLIELLDAAGPAPAPAPRRSPVDSFLHDQRRAPPNQSSANSSLPCGSPHSCGLSSAVGQ